MPTIAPDLSSVLPAGEAESSLIDRIVREGARQMLAAALQAEVDAYIEQFAGERDQEGRRLVVRNGSAEPRTMLTSDHGRDLMAAELQELLRALLLPGAVAPVGSPTVASVSRISRNSGLATKSEPVTEPRSKQAASHQESDGSRLGRPGRFLTCQTTRLAGSKPSASSQ